MGNLYNSSDKHSKKALKYFKLASKNGFNCDYEIRQLENTPSNFVNELQEFVSTGDLNKESVLLFCQKTMGSCFEGLEKQSKDMIVRSIAEYALEVRFRFDETNFFAPILSLAKALEVELDVTLGRKLFWYIEHNNLEKDPIGQRIISRKHDRTLGEYDYEYKKEGRTFDEIHLGALKNQFKDDLFKGINGDIHLTNYITRLVKDIKRFSNDRNAAAHKGKITKEKCEKWIDKMIGSGQMLQDFLHKLK